MDLVAACAEEHIETSRMMREDVDVGTELDSIARPLFDMDMDVDEDQDVEGTQA